MIKWAFLILMVLFLYTFQVSFLFSLPYPADRIPLVLVVAIYLYQYWNRRESFWILVCYGVALDVLGVSSAPLETLSYACAGLVMTLAATHVFTNRSFYGMSATAVICCTSLVASQSLFSGVASLLSEKAWGWNMIFLVQAWSSFFAIFLLLFVFPSIRRFVQFSRSQVLKRF